MDTFFDIVKTVLFGFGALLLALFVLAFLFGKRVRKQWEYEAEFRNSDGREYGEFEIELSQIEKEEPEPTVKLKLQLRDPALEVGGRVVVTLNDQPVFEAEVETAGRILARETRSAEAASRPTEGDVCRVRVGDTVVAEAEMKLD